jgi:hypothetical protein
MIIFPSIERGIVDSTRVLELIDFIEMKFYIIFNSEESISDNIDSNDDLEKIVMRKKYHSDITPEKVGPYKKHISFFNGQLKKGAVTLEMVNNRQYTCVKKKDARKFIQLLEKYDVIYYAGNIKKTSSPVDFP